MPYLAHLLRLCLALGLTVALGGGIIHSSAAPAHPGTARAAAFQTEDDDDDDDDDTIATPGTGGEAPTGTTSAAGIFAGSCDDLAGEPLHRLEDATFRGDDDDDDDDDGQGSGRLVGAAAVVPVTISDSEIPARLDDLLQQPHDLAVVAGSASGDAPLACGEIGGYAVDDDEGDLLFALQEQDNSGVTGIAVLDDDDDDGDLDVTLYLGSPDAALAGVPASTGGTGGATGAAAGDDATETAGSPDDATDDDGADDETDDG